MNRTDLKVGNPIKLGDQWAIIESCNNEFHSGRDEFVDILTLRWADGHQTRHTRQELLNT